MALFLGLTGGIGSGKSTVSSMLADRGAVVIDADEIARELQSPGGELYQPMIERFGAGILTSDGTIDRAKVAGVVFSDPEQLRVLNELTHPTIGLGIAKRRAEQQDTDNVVILDIPLLVEGQGRREGGRALVGVIVVDAPVDLCVQRVMRERGMTEMDARARVVAQAPREERLKVADFVVDNSGSLDDLRAEVARCWEWITALQENQRA